jgi:hypothetical protein
MGHLNLYFKFLIELVRKKHNTIYVEFLESIYSYVEIIVKAFNISNSNNKFTNIVDLSIKT